MVSYVSHLEGAIDGERLEPHQVYTLHKERPIWVRYDLEAVGKNLTKEKLLEREPTMWRYREFLPPVHDESIVSFGEGMTPVLRCERLGKKLGLQNLYIKDESQLPTGSFKSRGQSAAITMAKEFGITRVAIPTAGNAGAAMAAYAARAGMEAFVFMPEDTPAINQYETKRFGAKTFLVNGLITDCGKIVQEGKGAMKWFDISTLKEPYRIEGKKTMGLELAEQFDWNLPDVILYPTGGGTGLIGMWKAFHELKELGWLSSDKMPKMVAVQSDGCCPVVKAYDDGERFAEPFANAHTQASGLRVPKAVGDFMILDAVRESGGCAIAVPESEIQEAMTVAASMEGVSICPEAAACVLAAQNLRESDFLKPNDQVVIFNTGAMQKYPDVMKCDLLTLDKNKAIDYTTLS